MLAASADARMNGYYGPGYVDVDTTLVKNIRTYKQQQLQLRFETFNLFNHTNFAAPVSALNSTALGQIQTQQGTNSSPAGQRILQGAIKYNF